LFPFGFGLSYTTFALEDLAVSVDGGAVTASVTVRNSGGRAGAATPQFYVSGPEGANIPLRLAGFSRIDLAPGEDRRATISIDPRLFARFDEAARRWRIKAGEYRLTAGFDAERRELSASFALDSRDLPP
jgi:beta-glucosidase